jgi:Ca2+-binding RTX toxin-like protein
LWERRVSTTYDPDSVRNRVTLPALLIALGLLAAGSHAQAPAPAPVAVSRVGGTVTVIGTAGRDQITADPIGKVAGFYVQPPGQMVAGQGCTQKADDAVSCNGVTAVKVQLGDGDDHWSDGNAPLFRLSLDAGAGDDVIDSLTSGTLRVAGGSGDDRITSDPYTNHSATLLGGEGNDRLAPGGGRGGHSLIDGGPGNDRLFGSGRGRDRIRGRSGRDTIRAKDGHRDRINCGGSKDSVRYDRRLDRLTRCP